MPIIKIYSDKKFLSPNQKYDPIFYPFWGEDAIDIDDPDYGNFDLYIKNGKDLFAMTSIEQCDFAVLPGQYDAHTKESRQAFIELATKYGKPMIFFFSSDSDQEVAEKNCFIFRTSFYRSKRLPNEFALPGWSEDFIEQRNNGKLQMRQKPNKPVIGFCGFRGRKSTLTLRAKIKQSIKLFLNRKLLYLMRHEIRSRAIDILQKSNLVDTRFILYNKFWAGIKGETPRRAMIPLRKEYFKNIMGSDYCLAARGGGNFSFRLYEIMSCGRIPLFVDSDCVLPYGNFVDWKNTIVWVEGTNVNKLDKIISDFNKSVSAEEFLSRQKRCREIWEEWISPYGFYKNFYRHFEQFKNK